MNETNHFSMAYTWPWGSQVVDKKKNQSTGFSWIKIFWKSWSGRNMKKQGSWKSVFQNHIAYDIFCFWTTLVIFLTIIIRKSVSLNMWKWKFMQVKWIRFGFILILVNFFWDLETNYNYWKSVCFQIIFL